MSANGAWDGILDDGEEILWQGRPDPTLVLKPRQIGLALFGMVFAGFALFWMIMASLAGGFMWIFGLIHFSVGVALIVGPQYYSAYRRRNTWYTLTDRRAFIATELAVVGKKLQSYPIDNDTRLDFIDENPATIHFAETTRRTKNGSYRVPVGFERIEEGRKVYRLIRDIQSGEIADENGA